MVSIKPNTVAKVGKGVKVLFTNKAVPVDIESNRFVLTADLKADLGNTKSGKTYAGQVNRVSVEVDGNVFDINFYILKRNGKTPTPATPKTDNRQAM